MAMIKLSKVPRPSYYGIETFYPVVKTHIFSLSDDDMLNILKYYLEIELIKTNHISKNIILWKN